MRQTSGYRNDGSHNCGRRDQRDAQLQAGRIDGSTEIQGAWLGKIVSSFKSMFHNSKDNVTIVLY